MATSDANDNTLWGPVKEKMFIDILVDEINKGNLVKRSFSVKTLERIRVELNKETNKEYNKTQVKQKYNRSRAKHRLFNELLNRTEFGWDAKTNTVHAEEETWQTFLVARPKAQTFQTNGCPHYKLLGIIFNNSTVTRVLHFASTQDPPNSDDEYEFEQEWLNSGVHVDVDLTTPDNLMVQNTEECPSQSHKITKTNEKKRKRESRISQMSEAFLAWAAASKARAEVSIARAEKYKSETSRSVEATSSVTGSDFTLAKCVKSFEQLNDIDDDTFMLAVEKFKDADNREIFLTMSMDRQNVWLARLK